MILFPPAMMPPAAPAAGQIAECDGYALFRIKQGSLEMVRKRDAASVLFAGAAADDLLDRLELAASFQGRVRGFERIAAEHAADFGPLTAAEQLRYMATS